MLMMVWLLLRLLWEGLEMIEELMLSWSMLDMLTTEEYYFMYY